MTITLLCSSAAESYKTENKLITTDPSVEVHNPWHEESVRYSSRSDSPDDLIRRTIARLLIISDMALNISGQTWIDDICKILNIPVYHNLEEIVNYDDIDELALEMPEPDEEWCVGCQVSNMQPMPISVDICKARSNLCPTFKTYDEAFIGETKL